jgi:tetratricopeptide (TPR) repeat protein
MNLVRNNKLYILLTCLGILFFLNPYLYESEKKLLNSGYQGNNGMTQNTLLLRIMGMKKVGTDFIWIDQVLVVGEGGEVESTIKKIKENSDKMSFLDPYFLTNYNFSGSILGLIKIYKRFDLASEIFERGIKYNPNNQVLKNYYGGLMASSKNDETALLLNFEEIVGETRDDLLTNIVAYLYEKKYKEDGKKENLEKALKYWGLLLNSKDEKYQVIGKRKIEFYGIKVKKN